MKWKTIGRMARLAAYVVVPGAAGYAAYRYVIRPWLHGRAPTDQGAKGQGARGESANRAHSTPERTIAER